MQWVFLRLWTGGAARDEASVWGIRLMAQSRQVKKIKGMGKFVLEILRN